MVAVHAAGRESLNSYYAQEGTKELTCVGGEIEKIHADREEAENLKKTQQRSAAKKIPKKKNSEEKRQPEHTPGNRKATKTKDAR